jgi:hypothetical protein
VLIRQQAGASVERIEIWDRQRQAFGLVGEHQTASGPVTSVAVSNEVVAVGRYEGTVDIYSRADGRSLATYSLATATTTLGDGQNMISDLVFSPDGERLVAMSIFKAVGVYSTATWEPLLQIDAPPDSELTSSDTGFSALAFAPDGSVAYTYSAFNGLRQRDPVTFDVLGDGGDHTPTGSSDSKALGVLPIFIGVHRVLEMSADGTTMKLGDGERAVLIDVATLTSIGDPFPTDGAAFAPTPQYATEAGLLATIEDGRVVVRDVNAESWERLACSIPGLNLFLQGDWERLGLGGPVRKICDNLDLPQ